MHAMARSQDLLLARNWKGAAIGRSRARAAGALRRRGLLAHRDAAAPISSSSRTPCTASRSALHELATNAAKYGALSVPEGRVAIAWEVTAPASGEARFRMSWRETGGPPVTPPERKGFGHIVISEMVASSLRAQVALDYAAAGVSWTLDAPISSVTQATSAPEAQPAVAAS